MASAACATAVSVELRPTMACYVAMLHARNVARCMPPCWMLHAASRCGAACATAGSVELRPANWITRLHTTQRLHAHSTLPLGSNSPALPVLCVRRIHDAAHRIGRTRPLPRQQLRWHARVGIPCQSRDTMLSGDTMPCCRGADRCQRGVEVTGGMPAAGVGCWRMSTVTTLDASGRPSISNRDDCAQPLYRNLSFGHCVE